MIGSAPINSELPVARGLAAWTKPWANWFAKATAVVDLWVGVVVVANLPNAATAGTGARGFVTDSNQTIIVGLGTTVAGSGTERVPVYSDGTDWIIG